MKSIQIVLSFSALPHFGSRIVGGQNATAGQLPYIASIRRGNQGAFWCVCAIIRKDWVVAAADCFRFGTTDLSVVVGTHLISTGGFRHEISSIIVHPDYNPPSIGNDIALVQVNTPFTFTDLVQPIQISSIDIGGQVPAVVSGWGFTEVRCNENATKSYIELHF